MHEINCVCVVKLRLRINDSKNSNRWVTLYSSIFSPAIFFVILYLRHTMWRHKGSTHPAHASMCDSGNASGSILPVSTRFSTPSATSGIKWRNVVLKRTPPPKPSRRLTTFVDLYAWYFTLLVHLSIRYYNVGDFSNGV